MSQLVSGLLELAERQDRAALAALRRGLGKPPGLAGEMYPFVIPKLPPATSAGWNWQQQCHFIVASLFAWHPLHSVAGKPWERNFGDSARQLKRKLENSDGPERRFVALLNAESENLPDHLRSMIGLFRAHDIPVDWELLLIDLTRWSSPNRYVQTNWAKSFWRAASDEQEISEVNDDDMTPG